MPDSFEDLFTEAQREAEHARSEAEQREQQEARARTLYAQELEATRSAAMREAGIIAGHLCSKGFYPDVLAVASDASGRAWAAQIGRPGKVGQPKSERSLRRGAEKAESIRSANSFKVWRLDTSWTWSVGEGEDESRYTEYNYLDANGAILHGPSRANLQTEGIYLPVRTIEANDADLERFTSVRQGLAALLVRYGQDTSCLSA